MRRGALELRLKICRLGCLLLTSQKKKKKSSRLLNPNTIKVPDFNRCLFLLGCLAKAFNPHGKGVLLTLFGRANSFMAAGGAPVPEWRCVYVYSHK